MSFIHSYNMRALVTAFCLVLTGCGWQQYLYSPAHMTANRYKPPTTSTLTRELPPFNAIDIRGPMNVTLVTAQRAPNYHVRLSGTSKEVYETRAAVRGNTLYLQTYSNGTPHVNALICLGTLNQLSFTGNGTLFGRRLNTNNLRLTINGKVQTDLRSKNISLRSLLANNAGNITLAHVSSQNLDVNTSGSGNIQLVGVVALHNLRSSGLGRISVYWINSKRVIVRGDNAGHIFLAGTANLLDAEMSDTAVLDAKYLRVKNKTFVNTIGSSRAEVTTYDSLNAFASGSSNIYFYQHPLVLGKYMRDSGSVLFMGEAPLPCTVPMCPPIPGEPG